MRIHSQEPQGPEMGERLRCAETANIVTGEAAQIQGTATRPTGTCSNLNRCLNRCLDRCLNLRRGAALAHVTDPEIKTTIANHN